MNNKLRTVLLLCLSIPLAIAASGCKGFFVSGSTLDHINVTPGAVLLKVGETKQFTATGVNVDGNSSDLTNSATWTTGTGTVATVSNTGLVTAAVAGNTTVSAASSGVTGTANVIVNDNSLTGLTITSTSTTVAVGSTVQLTCTANFQGGGTLDVTNRVTWSSSSTSVATVSGAGLVTGVAAGTSTITANITTASGTQSGTISITVQ